MDKIEQVKEIISDAYESRCLVCGKDAFPNCTRPEIVAKQINDLYNQPISESLLLTDEEIHKIGDNTLLVAPGIEWIEMFLKAQIQHLIDLGWRPSKLPNNPAWQKDEELFRAFCAGQNSLIQKGWKSPEEVRR